MKKKHREETPTSPSSSKDDDLETSDKRQHRHRKDRRSRDGSSRREERKRERREEKRRKRREREDKERDRRKRKSRKKRDYDSESGSGSGSESDTKEPHRQGVKPEDVVKRMLTDFPNVVGDLKQLLQMIDDGQAVDIKGISERSLIKHLKKLFVSLNLKENGDKVFLLPSNNPPTLEVVGPLIHAHIEPKKQQLDDVHSTPAAADCKQLLDDNSISVPSPREYAPGPKTRMIGPEIPSAELLAAAAKLTEAQAELREAELEEDTELFIGPPPPAMVAEAESANEAERFEEVTRIMDVEDDSPYDVVGVNHNMSAENIKKRYWKLSL